MQAAESRALTLEQLDDHKQLQQIANMLTRVTSCNIDMRRSVLPAVRAPRAPGGGLPARGGELQA